MLVLTDPSTQYSISFVVYTVCISYVILDYCRDPSELIQAYPKNAGYLTHNLFFLTSLLKLQFWTFATIYVSFAFSLIFKLLFLDRIATSNLTVSDIQNVFTRFATYFPSVAAVLFSQTMIALAFANVFASPKIMNQKDGYVQKDRLSQYIGLFLSAVLIVQVCITLIIIVT